MPIRGTMTETTQTEFGADALDDERRTFLQAVGGTAAAATGVTGAPGVADTQDDTNETEPVPLTHGVASGDVTASTAVVWARAAEEATVHVEFSPDADFSSSRGQHTAVDSTTDFTGHVRLTGLQSSTRYHYRVWATADESGTGRDDDSPPDDATRGTFLTAPKPKEAGPVTFAWSGDTWGYVDDPVEPPFEGLQTIAERQPDFFLYHGDTIYADADTPAGQVTPDTPLVEALPIYRAKYKEMRDPPEEVAERTNLRTLLEATSVYSIWDDHEVENNFAGSIEPLMPSGRRAFFEYWPVDRSQRVTGTEAGRLYRSFRWGAHLELFVLDTRQYRDPNLDLAGKTLLGREQMRWLKSSLVDSDATWKVIATPAPMGHPSDTWATENERTGYESELLELVEHIEREGISNVVAVAADVHHSQVGAYDPDDDGEFEFYEAIAGPLGAYPGTPADLYPPLNPTEFFARGEYFDFGTVSVDESGRTLTIGIFDESGNEQFTKTIEAREATGGEVPTRIRSTFDEDADGWLVSQNGGSTTPEHYEDGGNPGGHIGDSEGRGGVAWYYQAPFEYLGDREAFYGGTLSFALRQMRTDQQFDADLPEGGDVALSNGETTLVYEFRGENSKPATEWSSFEVGLSAEEDWINLDSQDPFATEDEFRRVLSDLERLRIRGEYRAGADESRLDSVVLSRG